MVLRIYFIACLFFLAACERIPDAERKSLLGYQSPLAEKLKLLNPWLWSCRSMEDEVSSKNKVTLGERMESFIDFYKSKGLSSIEDFEVSRIRSAAFLWKEQGYLVTSFSAFSKLDQMECSNGTSGWRKVAMVGTDRALDLMVLKVDVGEQLANLKARKWTSKVFTDSAGEEFFVVSAPFPGQMELQSVRLQPSRVSMRTGIDQDLILFSPQVDHLFSSGVLMDSHGSLVGLITVQENALWGSALSLSWLDIAVNSMISRGRVEHGFLGLRLRPQTEGGLVVDQVEVGGPAYQAGLRVNDLLLEWNGRRIQTAQDWIEPTSSEIGRSIALVYQRNQKTIETRVQVGKIN